VEILFTTRPSTISRGSTHDAQQKCHSSPEEKAAAEIEVEVFSAIQAALSQQ